MNIKKRFEALIKKQGFRSLYQVSKISGIAQGNMYSNFNGSKVSLDRAFIYANTLGVPITDVLEIFCKEDMKKNREAIKKHKIPVED